MINILVAAGMLSLTAIAHGQRDDVGSVRREIGAEAVVWYTTWDTARAEARRSNRPILFFAAAHQCAEISGTF